MMNVARRMRSKSPFRSRSKSPSGKNPQIRSRSPFPIRRKSTGVGDVPNDDGLHQSEIDVFQQLCLDRPDENGAIEILLESTDKNDSPELYPVSSVNSDRSPTSLEPKPGFLKRLFKSPRKKKSIQTVVIPATPANSDPEKTISSEERSKHDSLPLPPPSAVRKARSTKHGPGSSKKHHTNRVLSERFDTYSNMSSLSGTMSSSVVASRRLRAPHKFDRHESLGMDSILDVRKTLKQMERQLGKASNNGERVSRQKVMNALLTVADSLEDREERDLIRKELQALMKKEHQKPQQRQRGQLAVGGKGMNLDGSFPSDPCSDKENGQDSKFSSTDKMFSVSTEEKEAAEQALDDLLWTEFVSNRKDHEDGIESKQGKPSSTTVKPTKKLLSTMPKSKPLTMKNRMQEKVPGRNNPSLPFMTSKVPFQQARSWWRRDASYGMGKGENHSFSSSSWDDDDLDIGDEEFDGFEEEAEEDEDEESTQDSESKLVYLPKNIIVRKAEKVSPVGEAYAFASSRSFDSSSSAQKSHYRVRMVDTESRLGFEMGGASVGSRK